MNARCHLPQRQCDLCQPDISQCPYNTYYFTNCPSFEKIPNPPPKPTPLPPAKGFSTLSMGSMGILLGLASLIILALCIYIHKLKQRGGHLELHDDEDSPPASLPTIDPNAPAILPPSNDAPLEPPRVPPPVPARSTPTSTPTVFGVSNPQAFYTLGGSEAVKAETNTEVNAKTAVLALQPPSQHKASNWLDNSAPIEFTTFK